MGELELITERLLSLTVSDCEHRQKLEVLSFASYWSLNRNCICFNSGANVTKPHCTRSCCPGISQQCHQHQLTTSNQGTRGAEYYSRGTLNLSTQEPSSCITDKTHLLLLRLSVRAIPISAAHWAHSRASAPNKIILSCDDTSSAFVDSKFCF